MQHQVLFTPKLNLGKTKLVSGWISKANIAESICSNLYISMHNQQKEVKKEQDLRSRKAGPGETEFHLQGERLVC